MGEEERGSVHQHGAVFQRGDEEGDNVASLEGGSSVKGQKSQGKARASKLTAKVERTRGSRDGEQ